MIIKPLIISTKPRTLAFRSPWSAQALLIGLALDESDASLVERALRLAGPSQAAIHLAHAFIPVAEDGTDALEAQRSTVAARLSEHVEQLGVAGDHKLYVEPGVPHRMLLDLARHIGADLLIVGPGSVAEQLIASGWSNVLVMPRDCRLTHGISASLPAVAGLFLG